VENCERYTSVKERVNMDQGVILDVFNKSFCGFVYFLTRVKWYKLFLEDRGNEFPITCLSSEVQTEKFNTKNALTYALFLFIGQPSEEEMKTSTHVLVILNVHGTVIAAVVPCTSFQKINAWGLPLYMYETFRCHWVRHNVVSSGLEGL
jgi:hypothetical protein